MNKKMLGPIWSRKDHSIVNMLDIDESNNLYTMGD